MPYRNLTDADPDIIAALEDEFGDAINQRRIEMLEEEEVDVRDAIEEEVREEFEADILEAINDAIHEHLDEAAPAIEDALYEEFHAVLTDRAHELEKEAAS